jgi:AcrR family transcriptional regulator
MPSAAQPEEGVGTGRDGLLQRALEYFAANGIGDASLRQIAAGIGSSHRMLIYHFGSREGLLTAVVEALEAGEKQVLADLMSGVEGVEDGRVAAWTFWSHIADVGGYYGPLFFELASHAMRGDDFDAPLRVPNVQMWIDALTEMWVRDARLSKSEARVQARLNVAVARGLLHDLLLTGDRAAVDAAMARFDFLSFGTPHPRPGIGRLSRKWTLPGR